MGEDLKLGRCVFYWILTPAAPSYHEEVSINADDFEWRLLALTVLSAHPKTVFWMRLAIERRVRLLIFSFHFRNEEIRKEIWIIPPETPLKSLSTFSELGSNSVSNLKITLTQSQWVQPTSMKETVGHTSMHTLHQGVTQKYKTHK